MTKSVLVAQAHDKRGAAIARFLATSNYIVYAGMPHPLDADRERALELQQFSESNGYRVRVVPLDMSSDPSIVEALSSIVSDTRLDAVVYRAEHPLQDDGDNFELEYRRESVLEVASAERVGRTILPFLRSRKQSLLIWVSGYEAAVDEIAAGYQAELRAAGVETTILCPAEVSMSVGHPGALNALRRAEAFRNQENIVSASDIDLAVAVSIVVGMPYGERPQNIDVETAMQISVQATTIQ